jgi:hypothetical protein
VKPDINSVEVHPQLSNKGHPVDSEVLGAGSLWPPKCSVGVKLILGPLLWLRRLAKSVANVSEYFHSPGALSALVVGKGQTRTGLREDETCARKDSDTLVTHTGAVWVE